MLMVCHNSENSAETDNISLKNANYNLERSRSFKSDLDCQNVLPFQKLAGVKIPDKFKVDTLKVSENVKDSVTVDFKLWPLALHKTPIHTNEIKAPSLLAMQSPISTVNVKITKTAFTPMIPQFTIIYMTFRQYKHA